MAGYLIRRLFQALLTLIGVSLITFVILFALPADPARQVAGRTASAEQVEQVRHQLGLDLPVWSQYGRYLGKLASGDLGRSYVQRSHESAGLSGLELRAKARRVKREINARGGRLGWGKGYYDATLAQAPRPLCVGYAHAVQLVPEVPRVSHDVSMDFVITDAGLIRASARANRLHSAPGARSDEADVEEPAS